MKYFSYLIVLTLLLACEANPTSSSTEPQAIIPQASSMVPSAAVPAWSKNACIYEVNIRQITAEGTFNAFREQRLDDIAKLGIDILWLMPVYPISSTKRKGGLGSYYAVSDFRKPNPEFGTEADLRALIERIHALNMKVIFDFVPNHTGWDHVWLKDHPDWYTQDSLGNVIDPIDPRTGESWGWTDVADLNHENPAMREAMISDLEYWLTEYDIDGYRMDVAGEVPAIFWQTAIPRLRAAKPEVFMLAEANQPYLRNDSLFAMDYGWSLHHLLNDVCASGDSTSRLKDWYAENEADYERGFHMNFITNHDENSWNGTVAERMGDNWAAAAVLVATFEGMPLIYSGQEAGLNKRVAFFEKDTIDFSNRDRYDFYTRLHTLKHGNEALWNGSYGGRVNFLDYEGEQEKTLGFYRAVMDDAVVVFLNFSDEQQTLVLPNGGPYFGAYSMVFPPTYGSIVNGEVILPPHGFVVLSKQQQR
ncbi:MAG: alpha-amylase family glycosyl hydrolase [Bacteroidota bacterium]